MAELIADFPIPVRKKSPWLVQVTVVKALMKREMVTRFGKYKFGIVWMIVEPLISTIIIGFIIGRIAGRTVPEIPYPFFLLNGRILLQLFTGSLKIGVNSIKANQGLLVYRTVCPLDPFIARFLFELGSTSTSFVLFCIIGMWMGVTLSFGAIYLLVFCGLLTWLMGCGMGLIFGVSALYYKEMEKVALIFQSPLIFISAVLVPIAALPNAAQEFILKNPLAHTIELSRKALFPFYNNSDTNIIYPFSCAIIVFFAGLYFFRVNRFSLDRD